MLYLGIEKGLAREAKDNILEILLCEEEAEEDRNQGAQAASEGVADGLMAIWLGKTIIAEEEFDEHAISVVKHVQLILTEFGKKRPKVRLCSSPLLHFILNTL